VHNNIHTGNLAQYPELRIQELRKLQILRLLGPLRLRPLSASDMSLLIEGLLFLRLDLVRHSLEEQRFSMRHSLGGSFGTFCGYEVVDTGASNLRSLLRVLRFLESYIELARPVVGNE
jgi:hypothetical protein